jgi:hypothetical protein
VAALALNPWQIYVDTRLPGGTTGQAYPNPILTATGGVPPYSWTVSSGNLPPGLTLSPAGVISGTPTAAAGVPYGFTVQVTDAVAANGMQAFSIEIQDP